MSTSESSLSSPRVPRLTLDRNNQRRDLVTLEWFTRCKAIPKDKTYEDFPVLVRVTAPWAKEVQRADVDVVAMLDNRGDISMVKEAMEIVINSLRSSDRLAIVVVASYTEAPQPHEIMALTKVSDDKLKGHIKEKVVELTTTPHHNNTNLAAALQHGVKVLGGRTDEERGKRVGCIVFLSAGGRGGESLSREHISPDYPVHCFGLGDCHDPRAMHLIAGKTSGAYHYVKQGSCKAAFSRFMSELTSVVATAVRISLKTAEGVAISSVEPGARGGIVVSAGEQAGTAELALGSLHAGEQKSFVVRLSVAEGAKRRLMAADARYQQGLGASKLLDESWVSVLRPRECREGEEAVDPMVASELARIRLEDGVAAMAERPDGDRLRKLREDVKDGYDGWDWESAVKELDEMMAGIEDAETHRTAGLPYMLSWLTCRTYT